MRGFIPAGAVFAVLFALHLPAHAQSSDALARLEARMEALAKENADLRARVKRMEEAQRSPARPQVVHADAPAAPVLPAAARSAHAAVPASAKAYEVSNPCGGQRFGGFYLGGNAGAISHSSNTDDLDGYFLFGLPIVGFSNQTTGATAGVQVGYDWSSCDKLFGLVADWNWADTEARTQLNLLAILGLEQSISSRMDWFSTLRARAGIVADDMLIYVTGGAVAAKIGRTVTFDDGFDFEQKSFSDVRWGLVGGAGVEYAFAPGLSASAEVLYMQFAQKDGSILSVCGCAPPTVFNFNTNDSALVVRGGLNYRWGY